MSRGKPLYLKEERYAALTYMVRKYYIFTPYLSFNFLISISILNNGFSSA